MNYLSIPHYRGTKEKYDKSKHSDGIFFTTDTHEIIANDTAYNELIDGWRFEDGTLTIKMTSGKTYDFYFTPASEKADGMMSKEDKKTLDDHVGNKNNPHQVTKAQIGLENVDNTSDTDKPISTATLEALNNKVNVSDIGQANGVAKLDENGKISSSQLPSYVDDVLEFQDKASFPKPGEIGKIYVELKSNLTYRWSGTDYVEISPSLALGETSSTAYAGDKGKKLRDDVNSILNTKLSHIDDNTPFSSTASNVTLNYYCYQNNQYGSEGTTHTQDIPVASTSQAGIVTAANMITLNTCSGMLDMITGSISSINENVNDINTVKIPELSNRIDPIEKTVTKLDTYGYIGVLPSWTPLKSLNIKSTSQEIINALKLRDTEGTTITEASDIEAIFDKCAVRGKYIIDNLSRAKVQIEFIGSFYVLTEICNTLYKVSDPDNYSIHPILNTIAFTYSKDSGFAVKYVHQTYSLYNCNAIVTSIANWRSSGDDYGLQLRLELANGGSITSPLLLPADYNGNNEPGLMRASDKKKLDSIGEIPKPIIAE